MNKRSHTYWREYFIYAAQVFKLYGWQIFLNEQPSNDGTEASIAVVRGRKCATISLCEGFDERTPKQQRHAVAHELIHLFIEPILFPAEVIDDLYGHVAYTIIYRDMDIASEFAIDALAYVMENLLQLPIPYERRTGKKALPRG